MCEAMASGLVPVTSNNTAIPEFVRDEETGYLCDNTVEMAAAIAELWEEPETFDRMSAAAARSIAAKASAATVVPAELALMQQLVAR